MSIAMIGPSGSGKGTYALRLVANFNLLHISTGDLFRESLANHTALGILARKYMDQGELVPDEVVEAMVEEWLWKIPLGRDILFDGFPRNRYQAIFLDELFEKMGRELKAAIYFKVPDDEIVRRLSGRVICRNCQTPYHLELKPPAINGICDLCRSELYQRVDDNPEIVIVRTKVAHRVTGPMVDYYQQAGKLIIVDGHRDTDSVYETLHKALKSIEQKASPFATPEELAHLQALKGTVERIAPNEEVYPSLDIVLIGGPGSGKGTQAEQLKKYLSVPHVATGDLFRENLRKETDLGRLARTYMDRGELVPDDVTEAMVKVRISREDSKNGFILDGFPRTLPQAESLTEMMTQLQRRVDAVLYIKVNDEVIVHRLSGRLICRNCQAPFHKEFNPPTVEGICDDCGGELYQRDDDNPATIRSRLKVYHSQTEPLIEYYRKTGVLIEIDGHGDVEDVTARIITAINELVDEALLTSAQV